MSKIKQTLITPNKCSHCKLKDELCEGILVLEGSILVVCPCFIDRRSKKEPKGNEEVLFPIKKKRKGKRK